MRLSRRQLMGSLVLGATGLGSQCALEPSDLAFWAVHIEPGLVGEDWHLPNWSGVTRGDFSRWVLIYNDHDTLRGEGLEFYRDGARVPITGVTRRGQPTSGGGGAVQTETQ